MDIIQNHHFNKGQLAMEELAMEELAMEELVDIMDMKEI
jgi:hypothetical protein